MKRLVAFLVLLCTVSLTYYPAQALDNEVTPSGGLFQFVTGRYGGTPNRLRTDNLLNGDLLYGWNDGCLYGEWSHIMMVVTELGVKKIIHASTGGVGGDGVRTAALEFVNEHYDVAASERINLTDTQRNNIVEKALWIKNKSNGNYEWRAPVDSNDAWQCAKLVYRIYKDAENINLWQKDTWFYILPGSIFNSSRATLIQRTSMINMPVIPWTPPEDMNSIPVPIR